MKTRDVNIDGVKFTLTELDSYGYSIGIRKWRDKIDTNHFIIKTVHRTFDKYYYYFPHTPIVIGEVSNIGRFSRKSNLRILDMPIKMPGNSDYRIPHELDQFDELIAKMVAFEHAINPYVNDYYAYLTVDQGNVPANTYQRKSGCHVYGFQGARLFQKRPVNRSYIAYDEIPPVFYPQNFRTSHLHEKTDNFFLSFDEQADDTAAITFDPYQILLMNAYTVHRSDKINYDTYRTFVRLSYDTMMFDRFGNTHNPMFHYEWPMITRDAHKGLKHRPLPKYNPDAY
jgi:hypothetical protein